MPGETWFFNLVTEVETDMNPHDLLGWIKTTEKEMGRDLTEKFKSRVIDIDILLAEESTLHSDDLQIPHPKLPERNFVLAPLSEIAPAAIHPLLHKSIHELFLESKDPHHVKIIEGSR
jgi:2-amino-4-hydroxy-6-hydroxymethyldihydropteridine diphosphokinase